MFMYVALKFKYIIDLHANLHLNMLFGYFNLMNLKLLNCAIFG